MKNNVFHGCSGFFLVFLWFFFGFPEGFLLEISPLVSPDCLFRRQVPKSTASTPVIEVFVFETSCRKVTENCSGNWTKISKKISEAPPEQPEIANEPISVWRARDQRRKRGGATRRWEDEISPVKTTKKEYKGWNNEIPILSVSCFVGVFFSELKILRYKPVKTC